MQATKTFASYSPAEVALRYLADPTPPSEAVREDFDAAVGHCTLDEQSIRVGCKWLQEVNATQRRI